MNACNLKYGGSLCCALIALDDGAVNWPAFQARRRFRAEIPLVSHQRGELSLLKCPSDTLWF